MDPGWSAKWRTYKLGLAGDPHSSAEEALRRLFEAAKEMLMQVCREYYEQPVRGYKEFGSHCP